MWVIKIYPTGNPQLGCGAICASKAVANQAKTLFDKIMVKQDFRLTFESADVPEALLGAACSQATKSFSEEDVAWLMTQALMRSFGPCGVA